MDNNFSLEVLINLSKKLDESGDFAIINEFVEKFKEEIAERVEYGLISEGIRIKVVNILDERLKNKISRKKNMKVFINNLIVLNEFLDFKKGQEWSISTIRKYKKYSKIRNFLNKLGIRDKEGLFAILPNPEKLNETDFIELVNRNKEVKERYVKFISELENRFKEEFINQSSYENMLEIIKSRAEILVNLRSFFRNQDLFDDFLKNVRASDGKLKIFNAKIREDKKYSALYDFFRRMNINKIDDFRAFVKTKELLNEVIEVDSGANIWTEEKAINFFKKFLETNPKTITSIRNFKYNGLSGDSFRVSFVLKNYKNSSAFIRKFAFPNFMQDRNLLEKLKNIRYQDKWEDENAEEFYRKYVKYAGKNLFNKETLLGFEDEFGQSGKTFFRKYLKESMDNFLIYVRKINKKDKELFKYFINKENAEDAIKKEFFNELTKPENRHSLITRKMVAQMYKEIPRLLSTKSDEELARMLYILKENALSVEELFNSFFKDWLDR